MNYKKLARTSIWVFVLSFAAMPLNLLIRVLYARSMSVEDYGLFYGCLAFFSVFSFFRELGLRSAATYLTAKYRASGKIGKIKTVYFLSQAIQIVVSIMAAGIILLFKNLIIHAAFKDQVNAGIVLNFFLIYWVLQIIYLSNISFFIGYSETVTSQAFEFMNLLGILIISTALLWVTETFKVPVLAYLIVTIIMIVTTFISLWYRHGDMFKARPSFDKSLFSDLKKYAFAMLLASVSYFIMTQIDAFMLQIIKGAESVAYYTTGVAAAAVILVAVEPLNVILLPIFTRLWHQKKTKTLSNLINLMTHNIIIPLIPLSIAFSTLSPEIVALVFGQDFGPSEIIVKVLAYIFIIKAYTAFFLMCLPAVESPQKFSKAILIGMLLNIALDAFFIPVWGLIGAAIATGATYLVMLILAFRWMRTIIDLTINKKKVLKIVFCTCIFIFSIMVIERYAPVIWWFSGPINTAINKIISLIAGFMIYSAALVATKTLDYKMLIKLKNLILNR